MGSGSVAKSSYSPKIADGKERIRQAALTTKSVPAPCPDPQAAEFLEQADESFDWGRLEGLIAGAQAEKVPKIEPGEKSRGLKLPNKVAASNLVATSMQLVVAQVLAAMAGLEGPEPFASLEDPEAEDPKEERKEPEKASAKQKAKAIPKKESKPKGRKQEAEAQEPEGKAREAEDKACDLATPRKDGGLFDDDDNVDLLQTLLQEGLCVTPQPSKNQVPQLTPEKVPAAGVSSEAACKPGKFGDARKAFIKRWTLTMSDTQTRSLPGCCLRSGPKAQVCLNALAKFKPGSNSAMCFVCGEHTLLLRVLKYCPHAFMYSAPSL